MKKIVSGMTFLAVLTASMPVLSQEDTEVGRLKERLMALEQKIYSDPAQSDVSSGTLMADFEARLGNLEEEAQKVYGAVEELGYTVNEFAKKMDLIAKDFDLRLTDLETSIDALKKQKTITDTKSKKSVASKKAVQKKVKKEVKPLKQEEKKQEAAKAEAKPDSIPEGLDAEDLYSKAYHLLVATSYDDSEKWMKEFIKRFPSHELADNAHYWLGEIYLVKESPEQAVVSFSTGLSKFPKGAKAPANLLKMGTAFKQMGKKDFAESSWKKLLKDYEKSPEAEKAIKELEQLKAEG